jgi:hypothetical protein
LLQKFQQASLFGNVNLDLRLQKSIGNGKNNKLNAQWNRMLQTLSHTLPSFDNINSTRCENIANLAGLYNANSEMVMALLKMTRLLHIL